MRLSSLEHTPLEDVLNAFEKAFADYKIQISKTDMEVVLKRRGFDSKLSFAAFVDDEIAAFTLNGIGNFNGKRMAYDTGTGTVKEHRGQGYATKIFEYSIPFLKEAGINHYLLEVLQDNEKAVHIYRKIGFKVTREFNYFVWKQEDLQNDLSKVHPSYKLRKLDVTSVALCASTPNFWDFHPSWQNSFESIERTKKDFLCFGAFLNAQLVGYIVFEPTSGDVTQIAVDREHRRKGVGTLLLDEALQHNKKETAKLVNTDTKCDSITAFMKAKGIEVGGMQFEMEKDFLGNGE